MSDRILPKSLKVQAEDLVWCTTHAEVHKRSLDPYNENRDTCLEGIYPKNEKHVHRAIGVTFHKGDFDPRDDGSTSRFTTERLRKLTQRVKPPKVIREDKQ